MRVLCVRVAQSCPTLCDPMDCRAPGSCQWNSPGKNTGVGCHCLHQRIFPTQGSTQSLLYCRWILYRLRHQGALVRVYSGDLNRGSLVAQLVKNLPAMRESSWVGKIPWRREWLSTQVFWSGEFRGMYSLWGRRVGNHWATFTLIQAEEIFPLKSKE